MAQKRQQPDDGRKEVDKHLAETIDEINSLYDASIQRESGTAMNAMSDFEKEVKKQQEKIRKKSMSQSEFDDWLAAFLLTSSIIRNASKEIARNYTRTDSFARKLIYGGTAKTYSIGHNYGIFQAETLSDKDTGCDPMSASKVEDLISSQRIVYIPSEKEIARLETKDLQWNEGKVYSAILGSLSSKRNDGIQQAVDRIEQVGLSDKKAAVRSAITKTTEAENKGRLDAYILASEHGIDGLKKWRTMLDERVRESHALLEGQTRPLHERFSNGLRYPGDPQGPPEEIYGCRCILVYSYHGISNIGRWREPFDHWKDRHNVK